MWGRGAPLNRDVMGGGGSLGCDVKRREGGWRSHAMSDVMLGGGIRFWGGSPPTWGGWGAYESPASLGYLATKKMG